MSPSFSLLACVAGPTGISRSYSHSNACHASLPCSHADVLRGGYCHAVCFFTYTDGHYSVDGHLVPVPKVYSSSLKMQAAKARQYLGKTKQIPVLKNFADDQYTKVVWLIILPYAQVTYIRSVWQPHAWSRDRVHGAIAEHWLCVQGRIQKVHKRGDGLLASYGERNKFFSGLRIPRPSVSKN